MSVVEADFGRLAPPSSQALVVDALRRRVALGVYTPGDRLPSERGLAELLGVGRMTVREAIRALNREGLLETTRGRTGGTRVARTVTRRALREITRDSLEALRGNYEFRLAVEPFVASLAARRATEAERASLSSIAGLAADGVATYRALDSRFHLALARASRNPHAIAAIERARAEFFMWADALLEVPWGDLASDARASEADHVAIASAVSRGHRHKAAELMASHLRRATADFERFIARRG